MNRQKRLFSLRTGIFIFSLAAIVFSSLYAYQEWRDLLMQPERVMDSLEIKSGMIIGEAGAGEGYFTFHLARRVGKDGRIYGNDIDSRALSRLREKAQKQGYTNIVTVLGAVADPLFPVINMDMIIMVYAFHDFDQKLAWLNNAVRYLKKEGRLVIIDRDPDKYGGNYSHFLTNKEMTDLVSRSDFELVHVETFLKRENIYIFRLSQRPGTH